MIKRIALSLGIIQSFVAIMAIPAGLSFILQPDGSGIGIPVDALSGTPFSNYLIPGIILLAFNGILSAIGATMSFIKHRYAGILGLGLGIFLVVWICFQVYFIGLIHFLQPFFFIIGAVEVFLSDRLMNKMKV